MSCMCAPRPLVDRPQTPHHTQVRNQQLTKESNELRLENDETRAQLEAVQTSAAPRAEV